MFLEKTIQVNIAIRLAEIRTAVTWLQLIHHVNESSSDCVLFCIIAMCGPAILQTKAHEVVVRGVEVDDVYASAIVVKLSEGRTISFSQVCRLHHPIITRLASHPIQQRQRTIELRLWHKRLESSPQGRIRRVKVDILEWPALVEDFVSAHDVGSSLKSFSSSFLMRV